MTPSPVLEMALYYSRAYDWHSCFLTESKVPFKGSHGFLDATSDPDKLARLYQQYPGPVIGIATGPSDLVVLDIDNHDGSTAGFDWWQGHGAIKTASVRTPSGGLHVYFNRPCLRDFPSRVLAPSVECKGDSGGVICPPSHSFAGLYRWEKEPGQGIADMPVWLIELAATPDRPTPRPAPRPLPTGYNRLDKYFRTALERATAEIAQAPEGQRNQSLNAVAYSIGRLVACGLSEQLAAEVLLAAALDTGLPLRESRMTIKSGMLKGRDNPREIASGC